MYGKFQQYLKDELAAIEEAGLYKKERNIESSQSAEITLADGSKALNFCANNYLGLSNSPRLIKAAQDGKIDPEAIVMLNITGAGEERFKSEHEIYNLEPSKVFPLDVEADEVIKCVEELFGVNK